MATASGRTPNRSVPCSANHVENVWNVIWSSKVARNTARMPARCLARPRQAFRAAIAVSRPRGRSRNPRAHAHPWQRACDDQDGPSGDEECHSHPECLPEHQERDRADAHLERDRCGGQGPVPRRQRVGQQRLQGRSLQVDARVEDDHPGDQPADAPAGRGRQHGHAECGQDEPGNQDRQPTAAARPGAIGQRAGQGHEQEQEHVVDRHHRADQGASFPERVADQNRHECREQRAGDTGKEAAEADDQAGDIRGA